MPMWLTLEKAIFPCSVVDASAMPSAKAQMAAATMRKVNWRAPGVRRCCHVCNATSKVTPTVTK